MIGSTGLTGLTGRIGSSDSTGLTDAVLLVKGLSDVLVLATAPTTIKVTFKYRPAARETLRARARAVRKCIWRDASVYKK